MGTCREHFYKQWMCVRRLDGAPAYPDEATLSKELLGYGDDPDAEPATIYAAWGKVLTTELVPGFTFITGGTGEDGGWLVEGGELRSGHTGAGASWLCTTFEGFGELSYLCTNITFTFFNAGVVVTNGWNTKYDNVIPFLSGKHLATWAKRTVSRYGSDDWSDCIDDEKLAAHLAEKDIEIEEKEKALSDWIIDFLERRVYGNRVRTDEQRWRSFLATIFTEYKAHNVGWLYETINDSLRENSHPLGYYTSNGRGFVYYVYRREDDLGEYKSRCFKLEDLYTNWWCIYAQLERYGRLYELGWAPKHFLGFAENMGADISAVKSALDEMEKIYWRYNELIDSVGQEVAKYRDSGGDDYDWEEAVRDVMIDIINDRPVMAVGNLIGEYDQDNYDSLFNLIINI